MNVQISVRHMSIPQGIKKLVNELCHQLHHQYNNIQVFDVTIDDINGPYKSGIDKRCHLKVRGHDHLVLDVDKLDTDIYCAIENAFRRLTQLLKRNLLKKQIGAQHAQLLTFDGAI